MAYGKVCRNKNHPLNNKEWLYEQYVLLDLSSNEIAKLIGEDCTKGNVIYYINKYGITKQKHGWNKGLTKETDARVAKYSEKNIISHLGQTPWNKGLTKETTPSLRGYKWSEEQKSVFSMNRSGDKHPMFGKHHTPEAIEKIRQASIGRSHILTEEQKTEISRKSKIRWETTDIRERMILILNTPEVKAKMSGENNPQFGKPAYPRSGHGNGEYYKKLNNSIVWLRSSFESRMAKLLDLLCIEWEYEGIGYSLGNEGTYFPDFWIPKYSTWLEVKGYMTDVAKRKLMQFRKLYPTEKLRILYGGDISDIEYYTDNNIYFDLRCYGISIDDQIKIWESEGNDI